jgi:hypothetical protein
VDADDIDDGPEKGEAPYVVRMVEVEGLGAAGGKGPVERGKGRGGIRERWRIDDCAQKRVPALFC